jgi:hypothetical protein
MRPDEGINGTAETTGWHSGVYITTFTLSSVTFLRISSAVTHTRDGITDFGGNDKHTSASIRFHRKYVFFPASIK